MEASKQVISWSELVFDKQFLAKIDQLSNKRFGDPTLADECATYVVEALAEEDWQRCKKYQGLSKPTTFLYTLCIHLIEEFSRHRFGRPRPASWLVKQGDMWVSLWRSLCLERQMVPSVIHRFSSKGFNHEQLKHAIKVIKARMPNCGQEPTRHVSTSDLENVEALCGCDDTSMDEESLIFERKAGAVFYSILQSILADDASITRLNDDLLQGAHQLSKQQQAQLKSLKESIHLTDNEKILIRMVYVDGLSKSRAARALSLPSHQGGKMINAVLSRMKGVFEGLGFELTDLIREYNA